MAIASQVHSSFKAFVGGSVEELDAQVREFTSRPAIDAKSIGVEFIEAEGKLLLTVGYVTGGEGYRAAFAVAFGWDVATRIRGEHANARVRNGYRCGSRGECDLS